MEDLRLARLLQEQFDREAATQLADRENVAIDKSKRSKDDDHQNKCRDLSPVDPSLELSDPNPNILTMFLEFNERYFWGRLSSIEVKWSPRMTLCAGLCVYEGKGGLCSVRLSTPLLKLRPRKDLVETLLHEMIHAYLFITDNDRDHDGHGPNFKNHMNRINMATGANISIYHNFHDEVECYKQHWWRCNGPCQNRRPYYGYVKRSMNREPAPRDTWWQEHQMTCGGKFTKIKEPENYKKKKGEKEAKPESKLDIRAFVGKGNTLEDRAGVPQAGKKATISGPNTDKLKAPVAGRPAQKGVMVNGVLIRKGTSSSSPLFSTNGGGAFLKTSADVVDLTIAACDDFEMEDDSWMLEADSGENDQATGRTAKNSNPDSNYENQNLRLIDTNNERRKDSVCIGIQGKDSKIPTKEFQPDKFKQGRIDQETNRLKDRKGPNGFVSVCEPVGSLPGPKKQTKFVFSESDSDSDLWEDNSRVKRTANKTGERALQKTNMKHQPGIQTSDAVKSVKPHQSISSSGTPMQDLSGHNLQSSAPVGVDKINASNWSTKDPSKENQIQGQINELNSERKEMKYAGQGYTLGSAEQGTSYLSLIRKTFNSFFPVVSQPTADKDASAAQSISTSTASVNKRKSTEGYSPEEIKRQKFDNVSKESATGKKLDDVRDDTVSGEDCVPCPVCNKPVKTSAINSHLDECLL